MADIRTFPEANVILYAPPGAKNVRDLPVHAYKDGVISCWQLSEEEMEEVERTGIIWLHVMHVTHPPIYVSGLRPFKKREEE